jgi:hypothetical protein
MRDYEVVVPRDCVAALTKRRSEFVLEQIRQVLKGRTPLSAGVRFPARRTGRRLPAEPARGLADRALARGDGQISVLRR